MTPARTHLAVTTLLACFATLVPARAEETSQTNDSAISVIAVRSLDYDETTVVGHVVALHSARIGARVAGRIAAFGNDDRGRPLDVGSHFERGAELFTLEHTALEAEFLAAQASETRSRAALADLLAGTRPERVAVAAANVANVEARLLEAQADLERFRRLVLEDKTAAPKRLEEIETKVRVLEAERDQAKANLDEARAGATPSAIELARAAVAEAEARTRIVKIDLDDSVVRAPFSGTITAKHRGLGDYVTPAPFIEVLEFVSTDDLEAEAEIVESLFPRITEGETPIVLTSQLLAEPVATKITRRVATVDPNTGTFRIRAGIPPAVASKLAPGAFLKLELQLPPPTPRLTIPAGAVVREKDGSYVFVAREGAMRRVRVELGDALSEGVVVRSGLNATDRVVLGPRAALVDGKALPPNSDK